MQTTIIEVTNNDQNWGKFLVGRMDTEWQHRSTIDVREGYNRPLLSLIGWDQPMLWVLDLQTREGAAFRPGGLASADLIKHRVWVCPMFEPFLAWLYKQDLSDLDKLPHLVNLPDAPFDYAGYRRPGPNAEEKQHA